MFRCSCIAAILVVLSLTGWAQNPFEQQAAADYTGVFISQTFNLRLYGPADNTVGWLRRTKGGKDYDVSAKVSEGTLRGTFSDASGSFPFSLKRSGAEYAFVAGSEKATLKKLSPLDLSGEWTNLDGSLTVKPGDVDGNQMQGTIFFKGQEYVFIGKLTAAGVIGSFSSGGQTFPARLLRSFMEGRLEFATGSYSALLTNKSELTSREAVLEQRRKEFEEELKAPKLPELHVAAGRGDVAQIRELLDAGAKVDARGEGGMQPIHYAAWFGRLNAVCVLVAKGADVKASSDAGQQPLHCAAALGALSTIEYLASQGADINAKDSRGEQPIHKALEDSRLDAVKCLVYLGADVNAKDGDDELPIHMALEYGRLDTIKCLVSLGADVNTKDANGVTLISRATYSGYVDTIKCLASLGADVNEKGRNGWTLVHSAAVFDQSDVIACLADLGADVNAKNEDGERPIHYAALRGCVGAIECLVKHGADVNAGGIGGRTPLDVAEEKGKTEAAAALRELGGKSGKK